jgi:hypothetical protein
MEQNTDDKIIISKLFVSQETLAERLNSIVELSKGVIHIIEESGEVLIEDGFALNNAERIFSHLLGGYFSFKSGFRKTSTMQLGEIADKLGVPNTTIPAPMNGLLNEKLVLKSEKGAYQINFDNYKKISDLLRKIRNKVIHSGGKNVS